MNFIYLIRLLTSLSIKLDFNDDITSNTLHGLIRITSSSSILLLFNSFSCSSFLYNSCISQILSSIYQFPFPLYAFSLSANILWIKYHRFSDIPNMLVVFIVQLLILACKITCFISVIVVLVPSTIFIISYTCFCVSIITSIPFSVLWYSLVQSSCSFLNALALFMLFNFLVMYGFEKASVVTQLLLVIYKDICLKFE